MAAVQAWLMGLIAPSWTGEMLDRLGRRRAAGRHWPALGVLVSGVEESRCISKQGQPQSEPTRV